MRLAGFLLSSPLACHAGLGCWFGMLAWHADPTPPAELWLSLAHLSMLPAFLPLIDAFPAPIDALFTNFSPHQSLIDALFTYACAIAHRQVNTSSIRD